MEPGQPEDGVRPQQPLDKSESSQTATRGPSWAVKVGVVLVLVAVALAALQRFNFLETGGKGNAARRIAPGSLPELSSQTMKGVFRHKGLWLLNQCISRRHSRSCLLAATGDPARDWKAWVKEAKSDIPPYPTGRFKGRGVVLATSLGMKYFTQAYVNIRVMRDHLRTKLPIEVMYADDGKVPATALTYLKTTFPDVSFVNMRELKGIPADVGLNGFHIKLFALVYSSFEEVLMLDTDNIPVIDPAFAFEINSYKRAGALFWPDFAGYYSSLPVNWEIFDLPPIPHYPTFKRDTPDTGMPDIDPRLMPEIQGGEVLINKRKTWPGLWMTLFINRNYAFFHVHTMHGDKNSYSFGFNITGTPYAMVNKPFFGMGRAAEDASNKPIMCSSGFGQRNPETGEICWIHRFRSKFLSPFPSIKGIRDDGSIDEAWRGWTHMSKQGLYSHWIPPWRSYQDL